MSEQLYRIHWRERTTGRVGYVSAKYPQWRAQEIVDEIYSKNAMLIEHWIEPVPEPEADPTE